MLPVCRAAAAAAVIAMIAGCSHTSGDAAKAAPARGAALYAAHCAACHGVPPSPAIIGPSLRDEHARKNRDDVIRAIDRPVPPMPKLYPAQLTGRDVDDIAAYVETL